VVAAVAEKERRRESERERRRWAFMRREVGWKVEGEKNRREES
jgi:hypothetical protein